MAERVNQILKQYLRCYINYNLSNWSTLLNVTEFVYEGTKETPFFLEYSQHLRAGPVSNKITTVTDLNNIIHQQAEV